MLNLRRIRDSVLARLKTHRSISEEQIHVAWSAALAEGEKEAAQKATKLLQMFQDARGHHPTQGWVMLDRSQKDAIENELKAIIAFYK